MYKDFYGFTTYPFDITPDPQFLYPSENYKDCLFYLLYALEREYGLIVLTGEIGIGKTFLLHTLVQKLDKHTHVAFLVHSQLNDFDVLQYASQELKLDVTGQSKAELLMSLKNFLLNYEMQDEKIVLIIDEAQNLSIEVLEELRLLTNFENAKKKLLQVVLVGQLQLEEKLRLPELTQLSQRIGFSCRLLPMNYQETKGYIERRLAVAGVTRPLFDSKALQEIFARSQGVPRVINLICDLALLFGFTEQKSEIGRSIITQVMKELNLYTPERSRAHAIRQQQDAPVKSVQDLLPSKRLMLLVGVAVCILLGAGVLLQSFLASRPPRESTARLAPGPQTSLPQSPTIRDQPLLPQNASTRVPPKPVQWEQTSLSYQVPTGKPWIVSLPPLQNVSDSVPVKVTLDTSNSTPVWLKFDSDKLLLSGTAPPQEAGQTYRLTFRAHTAHGPESRLQLALTLVTPKRP